MLDRCLLFGVSFCFLFQLSFCADRTFTIDYENQQFLKDGQPFRYISGEIHYFRIIPELWKDRLMRLRAAGVNAIQVYVPWNYHETFENHFNFDGNANITEFLRLAQEQDLLVLLRPGPYICAEWENGGLPYWLLKRKSIALRVYNTPYITAVQNYYERLLQEIKPMLYQNGGPIIMVQVENEYGSYGCDKKYLAFLRDIIKQNLGNDTILYTTDPPLDLVVECGSIEGVYPTVDFGVSLDFVVKQHFELQQKFSKGGPNVNSEYYPGWYTVWRQNTTTLPDKKAVIDTMDSIYNSNASFSIYMFHGGTNFGFWNGAEPNGGLITSYDYGAPVSENGDITENYLAIQDWFKKLPNWPHPPQTTPKNNPARAYGDITLNKVDTLLHGFNNAPQNCRPSTLPMTFEDLDHPYGFVVYQTTLSFGGQKLEIQHLKDHGYFYLNGISQGVIVDDFGLYPNKSITLQNAKIGDVLSIIVENHARQTYLTKIDPKGILSNVTLDGYILTNWTQCGVNFESNSPLLNMASSTSAPSIKSESDTAGIYTGTFTIDGDINDTWFNPNLFKKGQILINGFNLGRFWNEVGPQITLYVPGPILQKSNSIVVVELLGKGSNTKISLVDKPINFFG